MYIVLIILVIFNVMIFLNQMVLPIALPTIQQELHLSEIILNWSLDGYFLSLATFLLIGGKIADSYGHRKVFSLGVTIFAVASFFCGLSNNGYTLIASRIIQGIGGALMIPPSMPILLNAFPERKKITAAGLVMGISSIFMVLAPYIGGIFCQYLNWRYVFWINLPISFVGLLLTYFFVPKSVASKQNFNFLSVSYYIVGIVLITTALMQEMHYLRFMTYLCLGLTCFILLYFKDKNCQNTFIQFSLFKQRAFSYLGLNIFVTSFVFTITVFLPIYMQRVFSFSPSQTGYYIMLCSIPMIFAAPLAGKMYDLYGAKKTIFPLQLILFFSYLTIAFLIPLKSFWLIFPFLFLLATSITSIFTCSFAAGVNCIEPKNRGQAAGLLGTIQSFGINLGVAIIGSSTIKIEKLFSYNSAFSFSNFIYAFLVLILIIVGFRLLQKRS